MGDLVVKKVDGISFEVDEDEWEADKDAVIREVRANRETMRLGGPDTSKEAKKLLKENELVEPPFDPKDFGDELIKSPPKEGDK